MQIWILTSTKLGLHFKQVEPTFTLGKKINVVKLMNRILKSFMSFEHVHVMEVK